MGIAPASSIPVGYGAPRAIGPSDNADAFSCGRPPLDRWLRERALDNEGQASRTYVVCTPGEDGRGTIAGYYALAACGADLGDVPGTLKRNMPNPLPLMVLGRLAVDRRHAGRGIGGGLLKDALLRGAQAAQAIGIRAILVHAIDDDAVSFYSRYGFMAFPPAGRTLFLSIESVRR